MNRNAVGAASSREREGNSVDSEDPVIAAGSRSHGIDIRFGAFFEHPLRVQSGS
ncbi:MAG: hypothetical protein H6752_15635 [Candidatus Omnitrophica bacterium]|nr:hypothetical protein [Candidatus Omnitrophota bacterium]